MLIFTVSKEDSLLREQSAFSALPPQLFCVLAKGENIFTVFQCPSHDCLPCLESVTCRTDLWAHKTFRALENILISLKSEEKNELLGQRKCFNTNIFIFIPTQLLNIIFK